MAPVGQALAGQLPPQAVIYRDTCCHRNDPAGAPLAHLSCGHASTGWGEAPLVLGDQDLVLCPGEAAEFDTRVPHWFGSLGDGPVELLSLFGRQGERAHVRARPQAG